MDADGARVRLRRAPLFQDLNIHAVLQQQRGHEQPHRTGADDQDVSHWRRALTGSRRRECRAAAGCRKGAWRATVQPGGAAAGQLRGGVASADRGQPVLPDVGAGEAPGAGREQRVGGGAAAEVVVDDRAAGQPGRLGEERRSPVLVQMVQHMVGHHEVVPAALFASSSAAGRLAERHVRRRVPVRGEPARPRIRVNRRDLQPQSVPGRPPGQQHRHVAAAAADVQQGGGGAGGQPRPDPATGRCRASRRRHG